jgi:transcriptional regulator of acetoin/glycerol metabolism
LADCIDVKINVFCYGLVAEKLFLFKNPDYNSDGEPLRTIHELEHKAIIKALDKLNNNMSQVARSLGIS